MKETKTHDIYIRLGEKGHIKKKLEEIAIKNRITVTKLVITILEDFLEQRKTGKNFHLKLE